jgi:hypothetical protein
MLGSLARVAAEFIPEQKRISIALPVTSSMSRGSAISGADNLSSGYSPEIRNCLFRWHRRFIESILCW